jgi:hypothetical protein
MNEPATEVQHKARDPQGRQYYYYGPQHSAHESSTYLTFALNDFRVICSQQINRRASTGTGPLKDAALCAVRVSHPAAAATCERRSHDVKS